MDTEFVYSLSSEPYPNYMVKDAIRSITTLKNWVEPEHIRVFFTPPCRNRDLEKIEGLGVKVEPIESVSDPFALNFLEKKRSYGEMWNLCRSSAKTVIWLDCDTVISRDIWEVVEGDFDVKARAEKNMDGDEEWKRMFQRHGKPVMEKMINSGFVIFKNNTHKEIKDEWRELLEKDLGYYHESLKQDAYSLQLCMSEYEYEYMDENAHVLEWGEETRPDGYVYHYITGDSLSSQVRGAVKRRTPEIIHRMWRRRAAKKLES